MAEGTQGVVHLGGVGGGRQVGGEDSQGEGKQGREEGGRRGRWWRWRLLGGVGAGGGEPPLSSSEISISSPEEHGEAWFCPLAFGDSRAAPGSPLPVGATSSKLAGAGGGVQGP